MLAQGTVAYITITFDVGGPQFSMCFITLTQNPCPQNVI